MGPLPPNPPTSTPTPQTIPPPAPPSQTDTISRPHRAEVRYASGLLSINANNSSLNSILREISKQTGMKITGGVREERVFGHYGPASPGDVLAMLLGGTGTNMLLRQTASHTAEELILTPRAGGASPPNPNAAGFNDEEEVPENQSGAPQQPIQRQPNPDQPRVLTPNPGSVPPSIPQPANNVNGSPSNTSPTAATLSVTNSVPLDSIPTPSTAPPANGIVDAPNPPDPGTVNPVPNTPSTDPADPGNPKTPEQIYQQLQQLRQQKQQQQAAAPH